MPPILSDDEMSDGGHVGKASPPISKRGKKTPSYAEPETNDDSDNLSAAARGRSKSTSRTNGANRKKEDARVEPAQEEGEDDDDVEEDEEDDGEYEVQEIIGHTVDAKGVPRFRVLWKGYDDPSDHTWEPEEHLMANASAILEEYYIKNGGREAVHQKPKGKKRGRPSASASATGSVASTPTASASKRSRKVEVDDRHPAKRELPAAAVANFKPPSGSWEDEVVDVEMFRTDDGELRVFLTWKNGHKSQHPAQQAYIRCPQKILKFYESRISFKNS